MHAAAAEPGPASPTQRLMSLDMLRGFDMFWILGADSLVYALNRMSETGPTRFLARQLVRPVPRGFLPDNSSMPSGRGFGSTT